MSIAPTHTQDLPVIKASLIASSGRFTCPTCGFVHQAWYHRLSADKVELRYRCDRAKHYWYEPINNDVKERWKYVTVTGVCEFVPGLPISETWAPGFKKKQQLQAEMMLPLMVAQKEPTK